MDQSKDITPWLAYFLEGLIDQSGKTITLVNNIVDLHDTLVGAFESKRAPALAMIIEQLFKNAAFTKPMLEQKTGLSRSAIEKNLKILMSESVVEKIGVKAPGRGGADIFIFPKLFDITDS